MGRIWRGKKKGEGAPGDKNNKNQGVEVKAQGCSLGVTVEAGEL